VRAVPKPGVCLDAAAQEAEVLRLVQCPALGQSTKVALLSLFTFDSIQPTGRLRLLGDSYLRVLGASGDVEPYCGLEGIYEN
jgi:hypothetical protein